MLSLTPRMDEIPSATPTLLANPTTPVIDDGAEWITAYLIIHLMSEGSKRYAYLLWIAIGLIFIVFAILHLTGSRGGAIGAYWSKWALRRRTWRGKYTIERAKRKGERPQPTSLPSNGQLLCLFLLPVAAIALSFVGPDYISPTSILSEFGRKRSEDHSLYKQFQPQYTIHKAWWTVGGRTGIVAFAVIPLCILFALKAPPFALFALPFTTQIHFDKLAWLHRWSGRLIYFITIAHVAAWSIQLFIDRREGTGKIAYQYAWLHKEFIFGWIAFVLMTLIIALSSNPIRKNRYKAFYTLHVILVPLMLIMSAFHHPPLWWWCWAALALWAGERVWRGTWWLHMNGFFGSMSASLPGAAHSTSYKRLEHSRYSSETQPLRGFEPSEPMAYPPRSSYKSHRLSTFSDTELLAPATALLYTPPPGYAHAELLSGATVRLTFITPGFLSWAPGQHFIIGIPSVSKIDTHPFTSASICDDQAPSEAGRAIVFLVRSKNGWTKQLRELVLSLSSRGECLAPGEKPPPGTIMPPNGVLLRMFVDGPFGSSVRAHWGSHSTVLIIVGGSGVSFGMSILEYVCLCLAGRDGKHLGGRSGGWGREGYSTQRVRFVWLVREFGHIQWCASIIRRCMAMIPSPGLDVDIFVTNFKPSAKLGPTTALPSSPLAYSPEKPVHLVPPSPKRTRKGRERSSSTSSMDSDSSVDSCVDLNPYTGEYGDEDAGDIVNVPVDARENYTLDLTNFDGDDEVALPGEAALNRRVMTIGKARRAKSRKAFGSRRAAKGDREQISDRRYHYQRHDRGEYAQSMDGLPGAVSPPAKSYRHHRVSSTFEHDLRNPVPIDSESPYRHPNAPLLSPPSQAPLRPPSRSSSPRPMRPNTPDSSSLSLLTPPIPTAYESNGGSISRPTSALSQNWDGLEDASMHGDQLRLEVKEQEMRDVAVVSEHARPGKPKIFRILEDEVQRANGSVVVACCGPTSLNAMIRKSIAAQIDPARIRRGDRRGYIDIVSEEFEY